MDEIQQNHERIENVDRYKTFLVEKDCSLLFFYLFWICQKQFLELYESQQDQYKRDNCEKQYNTNHAKRQKFVNRKSS